MSLFEKLEEAARRLSEIRRQKRPLFGSIQLEKEEEFAFALTLDDIFDQPVFFSSHRENPDRLALVWMPREDAVAIAEIDLREALCRRIEIFNIWALLDKLIALEPAGGEQVSASPSPLGGG